mmetsp:Transcript_33442/g.89479  ORF Transcript_33442/g.89479 Transcript_33442/m.89479 type:complete len:213 (-) Transcript_33442:381-1019(-)
MGHCSPCCPNSGLSNLGFSIAVTGSLEHRGGFNVLQTQGTHLVELQPAIDARPVEAVMARQPADHLVQLKIAETDCTGRLRKVAQRTTPQEEQAVDDGLTGSLWFRRRNTIRPYGEAVVVDCKGCQESRDGGADNRQRQTVQTRASCAGRRVPDPGDAEDEPTVGGHGDHLVRLPGKGPRHLLHAIADVTVEVLRAANPHVKHATHWCLHHL